MSSLVPTPSLLTPVYSFRLLALCRFLLEVVTETLASQRKHSQMVLTHFRLDLSSWVGLQLLERQT